MRSSPYSSKVMRTSSVVSRWPSDQRSPSRIVKQNSLKSSLMLYSLTIAGSGSLVLWSGARRSDMPSAR